MTNHRKLVECLVKVNPELATEIWQGMPCAILVLNRKSLAILELNPQAELLFALSREALIGKTLDTFFRDDGCVQDLHQLTDGINSPGSCYTSSVKLGNGTVIAVEVSFTHEFTFENQPAVICSLRDMSRWSAEIDEHLLDLKRIQNELTSSLKLTIEAISRTMEWRDPYTAGHQKRVSKIAVAIGQQLGWDEKRLQGLYMSAMVHDIGKIGVPSEILTKPGLLTEIERKLVQEHPETGYQILKDLAFDLPIADIVRQHHERMDGSGYPAGLHGEQILPEARVIAVSDVIEAMSTHRPYRPAVGLEAALKEIEKEAGVTLDKNVVDAALALKNSTPSLREMLADA